MILCNGSHVIRYDHKHGNDVYRCTMDNARKLLAECLRDEAIALARLNEQLKTETRSVRPVHWLTKALAEVRDMNPEPERLRTVLYGGKPSKGEDTRPTLVITKAMQDELVLFFFHEKLNLQTLGDSTSFSLETLTSCWETLSFLEPARTRLESDLLLVNDDLYEGQKELKILLADRWKETAREEGVVSRYCSFMNEWGRGTWSVERLMDA